MYILLLVKIIWLVSLFWELRNVEESNNKKKILYAQIHKKGLNITLDNVDRALNCQEQYSKRNCLSIHSISKENEKKYWWGCY